MIDAEGYIRKLISILQQRFGERLTYVGLQGSYLRGEATEDSDLDIMVVMDGLSVADLDCYRSVIQSLEHADKSCGFICSKEDLRHWNPLEVCNLLNSTKDYYGSLRDLVPMYSQNDVQNFAKISLNNLFHEICHRYIHDSSEKNKEKLPFSYKNVFFILQTVYYLRSGEFIPTKAQLLRRLSGRDKVVLELAAQLQEDSQYDFSAAFETLFLWCQETLASL